MSKYMEDEERYKRQQKAAKKSVLTERVGCATIEDALDYDLVQCAGFRVLKIDFAARASSPEGHRGHTMGPSSKRRLVEQRHYWVPRRR